MPSTSGGAASAPSPFSIAGKESGHGFDRAGMSWVCEGKTVEPCPDRTACVDRLQELSLCWDENLFSLFHVYQAGIQEISCGGLFLHGMQSFALSGVKRLSGELDDSTIGLQAIKTYGGIAMAQEPAQAAVPACREADRTCGSGLLPAAALIAKLVKLVTEVNGMSPRLQAQDLNPGSGVIQMENQFALSGIPAADELDRIGTRSTLTCPECHGTLWELKGKSSRFRCHTGHDYTAMTLTEAQNRQAEDALRGAVRALHEKHALLRRFAERAQAEHRDDAAAEYQAAAEQAVRQSGILRKLINGQ